MINNKTNLLTKNNKSKNRLDGSRDINIDHKGSEVKIEFEPKAIKTVEFEL